MRALAAFFRFAMGGCLLLAIIPLLLLVAIGIGVTLGRPVLFRQGRSGLQRRTFKLVKFRTMRNTQDSSGNMLPDEQRVTSFGRFLRRSRIDELPSLWNIMVGDLAFVGPRPLLPDTINALSDIGVARGTVLPGLTGWTQVNGNTLLSLQEKVALDIWYVTNRSIFLDAKILARTLLVVVFGERIPARTEGPDRDSSEDSSSTP